eukprot:Pgem_evm1s4538
MFCLFCSSMYCFRSVHLIGLIGGLIVQEIKIKGLSIRQFRFDTFNYAIETK